MRLFFLTSSLIGSINDRILILTSQQVAPIGLSVFTFLHLVFENFDTESEPNICNVKISTNNVWMSFFEKYLGIFGKKCKNICQNCRVWKKVTYSDWIQPKAGDAAIVQRLETQTIIVALGVF